MNINSDGCKSSITRIINQETEVERSQLQSDLMDLDCENKETICSLVEVQIQVFEGIMQGSGINFRIVFPKSYPYSPPYIYLIQSQYSDRVNFTGLKNVIDDSGRVMLPIFSDGWSPVLDFSMIVFELEMLVKTGSNSDNRSALDIQDLFYDKMRIVKHDPTGLNTMCIPHTAKQTFTE